MKFLNLFSPSKGGKRTSRSAPGPRRTARPTTARRSIKGGGFTVPSMGKRRVSAPRPGSKRTK